MKLQGGVNLDGKGLTESIRAMHMEMEIMGIYSQNVTGFDKVGYQRKEPVVSSFAEYLGIGGLSEAVEDEIGRIAQTTNPLDIALSEKGYFQLTDKNGSIELSRDGRFKLTKDGNLVNDAGKMVLSAAGAPVRLSFLPGKLEDIKINALGQISVFNPQTKKMQDEGSIAVVSTDGALITKDCVRQGYVENSNVTLQREFLGMVQYRKSFDANRQLFMLQNNKLQRAIQTLGSV